MINPQSLAFDIDGVVADTMTLFLDIARNDFGINHVNYEDITCYILEECIDIDTETISKIIVKLLDGSRDSGLKPIEYAPDILNRLGRNYGPVRFVTARPNLEPISEWMQKVLSIDDSQMEIVATGSFEAKTEVLLEKNISWFVEDRLETCFLLKDAGINPILYKQPWNREIHPFIEIGNWQELESLIKF